jgi:hypothetical protein
VTGAGHVSLPSSRCARPLIARATRARPSIHFPSLSPVFAGPTRARPSLHFPSLSPVFAGATRVVMDQRPRPTSPARGAPRHLPNVSRCAPRDGRWACFASVFSLCPTTHRGGDARAAIDSVPCANQPARPRLDAQAGASSRARTVTPRGRHRLDPRKPRRIGGASDSAKPSLAGEKRRKSLVAGLARSRVMHTIAQSS